MVNLEDVISVPLSQAELQYIQKQARAAEIGGRSRIRNGADRQALLKEDQIIGQIGTYAGIKTLFGDAMLYRLGRYFANIYPNLGDGGSDVPGANIDFKTSYRRGDRPLLDYRLAVRPHERHPGMVYVLILVDADMTKAHLIGWLAESSLPTDPEPEHDGGRCGNVFAGAFTVKASELHPLMPVCWFRL